MGTEPESNANRSKTTIKEYNDDLKKKSIQNG